MFVAGEIALGLSLALFIRDSVAAIADRASEFVHRAKLATFNDRSVGQRRWPSVNGSRWMGMQFLKSLRLKGVDAAPIAHSPGLPLECADFCVVASQGEPGGAVGRADKLYSCEMRRSSQTGLTASGRALSIGRLRRPPTNKSPPSPGGALDTLGQVTPRC